jgi:hypothetical protein
LAKAPAEASRNLKPMAWLVAQIKEKLAAIQAQHVAEGAYGSGDFAKALPYFELIEHFEQTDARRNGKNNDYAKNLNNNAIVTRLLQIPSTIVVQPNGAALLAANLQLMGPIAQMARLPILIALTNYYALHQQSEMVLKFATAALPQLKLGDNDQPQSWDVQLACNLAYSQMLQKDIQSAVRSLGSCIRAAKRFGEPHHLAFAHQISA